MAAYAYYNEIDPFAVAWLRKLMWAGLITDGEIDDRSIEDVLPADLVGYTQHHFFAGIGCWSIALRLCGWPDDRPVCTGSCPCQPFSKAGKSKGFADERHIWPAFHWLIQQYRPTVIFGEQVGGGNILPWLDLVSDDLEAIGYTVRSCDFPAASVGAYHIRQRLYWCGLADPGSHGWKGRICGRQAEERETLDRPAGRDGATCGLVHAHGDGRGAGQRHHPPLGHGHTVAATGDARRADALDSIWRNPDWLYCRDEKWRPIKPGLEPLVDGFAGRMAVLRGIGNAIVPQQAAAFIQAVMEEI